MVARLPCSTTNNEPSLGIKGGVSRRRLMLLIEVPLVFLKHAKQLKAVNLSSSSAGFTFANDLTRCLSCHKQQKERQDLSGDLQLASLESKRPGALLQGITVEIPPCRQHPQLQTGPAAGKQSLNSANAVRPPCLCFYNMRMVTCLFRTLFFSYFLLN